MLREHVPCSEVVRTKAPWTLMDAGEKGPKEMVVEEGVEEGVSVSL
jgi:hypothetical protein